MKEATRMDTAKIEKINPVAILFSCIFCCFVVLNVFLSQAVPSLYEGVLLGQTKAIVSYLNAIEKQDFYKQEEAYYKNISEGEVVHDLEESKKQEKKQIEDLEATLIKNPKTPSVLYALAILYKQEGNNEKSFAYFKKAQQLDPTIK